METPQKPLTRIKATKASKSEIFIPRVLNKYRDADEISSMTPDMVIDISRAGKWGNPFQLRKGATDDEREDCILKFSEYLMGHLPLLDEIGELTGKFLVCTCAPKACHGDILLVLANPAPEKKIERVVARVKAPVKQKPIVRIKPGVETVRVRIDAGMNSEAVLDVPKEDEEKAEAVIAQWQHWSKYDELWHFGGTSYNTDNYQRAMDRARLYYEWKYSHPGPEIYEATPFDAFLSGFSIGEAYGKGNITPEHIKEWKAERAKKMKLDKQDPNYDDIPY